MNYRNIKINKMIKNRFEEINRKYKIYYLNWNK